ncbi:hypothetical protein JH06_4059 [Blastocystis sp. subtype 4]|uniref:hypothetical protein n=1 Tax=Blastocystis sp. subtype 4 TaxID=944170 RepID=UPI0007120101|nr:hypothetical protein JH06_4059 [Blastocystis sp. subtype 4]KNB42344.1 hypothetical protein JH06_4059 [Blastocystis sp. subtype 4]|eukprot:XP_014525787.1 hypothetical protein JH06_4059 [Blastocystis sp. subtype 4]
MPKNERVFVLMVRSRISSTDALTEYFNSLEGTTEEIQSQIKGMGKEGCLVRITRSSLPEDIGLEGIVLLETKNQFTIITKKNCIRKVNKKDHNQFPYWAPSCVHIQTMSLKDIQINSYSL